MKSRWLLSLLFILGFLNACGGGGGGGSSPAVIPTPTPPPTTGNVQPMSVNLGVTANYVNGLFASVVLCVPGTSTCQTINDVLVDTGSFGLRIMSSALKLSLPIQGGSSNPVGECAQFVEGFQWGPVAMADVKLAGETAADLPIEIVGSSSFPAPPADCTDSGLPPIDTVAALRANGILGIGLFVADCGPDCASSGPSNPGFYFSCPASGCVTTNVSVADQVQNPVASFPVDNNGVLLELPSIGAGGAGSVSGSLIFGIGTESNNGLGSANVYTTDDVGNFTTSYMGTSYPESDIDSGSNGIFFLTQAVTGIPECSGSDAGFYCPATTQVLSATNMGQNGTSAAVPFNIENAQGLIGTGNAAFNDLGGISPGNFDWGLPFFFGRNVFVAIAGASTPGGVGPYWAY